MTRESALMSEALTSGSMSEQRRQAAGTPCVRALLFLLWTLLGAALGSPALAQEAPFPALSGRVVDGADLLPPDVEAAITETLADHEAATKNQVVVATVPDLGGRSIEDYGVDLGRAWGIGQAGRDNGAILLVSRDDRKVRIEVGYGLEGTLTDALSALIVQNDILPEFRDGDYASGITKGVDGILEVLSGDAAALEERAVENDGWDQGTIGAALFFILFFGLWFIVLGTVALTLLARVFGRKVGKNRWAWLGTTWTMSRGSPGGFGVGGIRVRRSSSSGGGFSGGGGSFGGGGSSGSW